MMSRRTARVITVYSRSEGGAQRLETDCGPAIGLIETCGELAAGDTVLLNTTAVDLGLGTGGVHFVIARIAPGEEATHPAQRSAAHLMKWRYTPLQHAVPHIEERPDVGDLWERDLGGMPVVATLLHSQLAPIVAAAWLADLTCGYVMTDGAALSAQFSRLAASLHASDSGFETIAVGQASGADYAAVTPHTALLFARHALNWRIAAIGQGPGNTGTGTKYGFSGIEQAALLDTVAALGGAPIAAVRASSGDGRARHRGISHHSLTVLDLVRSRCTVALPEGVDPPSKWIDKHDVRSVGRDRTQPVLDLLAERGIEIRSMGRSLIEDPVFFHAAAAAGVVAADSARAVDSVQSEADR